MNSINKFNEIIDTIEDDILSNIDINKLAQIANVSVYEFRRIFSYIAEMPISEYIRKRKLSLSAQELLTSKKNVTEIATEYGYDTAASFARAFKAFHGVTPTELTYSNSKMFTKISFETKINGGQIMDYKIVEDTDFYICGISGISNIDDTECCEQVWNKFDFDSVPIGQQVYSAYVNNQNDVKCYIGTKCETSDNNKDSIYIPKCHWATFSIKGSSDKVTNEFYNNIIYNWLDSSIYKRDFSVPNIEIYPQNMDDDDFLWEVRIPIVCKK